MISLTLFPFLVLVYGFTWRQASAETCGAGRYCSGENWAGTNECSDCPAGSYCPGQSDDRWGLNCWSDEDERNTDNNAPRTPCPKGRFSSETARESCITCWAGKYQSNRGQTSCTSCTEGNSSNDAGVDPTKHDEVTDCTDCVDGTYQSETSSASCTLCPPNTYSTSVGTTSSDTCLGCPDEGQASIAGSTECYDKPLPLFVFYDGECDVQKAYNGNYDVLSVTASGRYYYKKKDEERFIYWDPYCDGAYSTPLWVFDDSEPSLTEEGDLINETYLKTAIIKMRIISSRSLNRGSRLHF